MMRDDELFAYAKELRAPSVALEALKTARVPVALGAIRPDGAIAGLVAAFDARIVVRKASRCKNVRQ
jgi:hypothetical protein